jgi:hypothetical protein
VATLDSDGRAAQRGNDPGADAPDPELGGGSGALKGAKPAKMLRDFSRSS